MDPGGSDLESSLPQPETPCLIVEDSQPDSVALEDDPESSYRAVLARRLSSLQPSACSPVLELISSPLGSRGSQTDSQSDSCQTKDQAGPGNIAVPNHHLEYQEESQVLNVCPPPNKQKFNLPMDSDSSRSTEHCDQSEEGTSQFGFLALSQSQNVTAEEMTSQEGDSNFKPSAVNKMYSRLGHNSWTPSDEGVSTGTSENPDHEAVSNRSEVGSSSLSVPKINVQALLHSQCLQDTGELDQQDCEIISSQRDMFDAGKTDSTVSEPEQQGQPTSTPAHSLRLLHVSQQGTLAQESLSQSSVDYIAPTPDNFPHIPLIVPNSPTGTGNQHGNTKIMSEFNKGRSLYRQTMCALSGADGPMDASQPPEQRADLKKGALIETYASSQPQPPTSTPVSQNSPAFVLEQALSLPSQPEFSHDVFVPTLSQEAPQQSDNNTSSLRPKQESPHLEPSSFTLPLQLCVDTENSYSAMKMSEEINEDSQATQIEELEELPGVDTADSVFQGKECNGVTSEAQIATSSKACSQPTTLLNVHNVNVEGCAESSAPIVVSCSQPVISQGTVEETVPQSQSLSQKCQANKVEMNRPAQMEEVAVTEDEEVRMEAESSLGSGASGMALILSQSQLKSPDDEEREDEDESMVVVGESQRDSQAPPKTTPQLLKGLSSQSGNVSTSTNGHHSVAQEPEELQNKSLCDSSGDISFHFTLPKEGELIGPAVGSTPPLINQLKRTLRHSTPIETFCGKSDIAGDVGADVVMADIVPAEDTAENEDTKLSLRMKLVTPVEEGSSERFSLQKHSQSDEDGSVAKVTAVAKATSSPSVFSRVRQAHRQQEAEDDSHLPGGNGTLVRGELFASPQRTSQTSMQGCTRLSKSHSEASQQEVLAAPLEVAIEPQGQEQNGTELSTPNQKDVSKQSLDNTIAASPSSKNPPLKRTGGPSHRRHVRTIQEVRTTITRIITDVYYEDGKEVDRKVTEENEDPVVDCQVLDSDVSQSHTGSSSLTSGDLGDISSLSSKASSLQHSSGGASSTTGLLRPEFVMPPSRGAKSISPRRGGGQKQRGHRGQGAGAVIRNDRGYGTHGSEAVVTLTPRGRARRGRPPSRGGDASSLPRLGAHLSSSEDEHYTRVRSTRLLVSPRDADIPCHADALRSSPEEANMARSSFVGLRVVAKWSSNGYFYSGRIVKDPGEGRFRLRFDDGYECEVAAKDVLLCDPIPLESEVTALLEDEFFSVGVIKGYKTEGQDLFYSVERDDQKQWYNRTSVILSLEQGNKLREQHGLGPYEPSTPLAKASDISLDNLMEGKRRRRGISAGPDTPNHSSSRSQRTPGPSSKRRLSALDNESPAAKRGRKGPGARPGQRVAVCNTSGSGTDLPGQSRDPAESHGPMPQNTSLFMGFAFMLTASSESDRLTNKLTSEEEEEDYVQTGPYDKAYTECQLQAGGGFVLPDFNEEQCKAAYQSLLIADQHCRTRKYVLCLASGVPCVSHIWVRDCCNDNKLLNYRNYLLPAGMGPDDGVVEWHPRCSPFKDLRVLVAFEKPVELWSQLATMGGASAVRHFHADKDSTDIPAGKYEVVVTDHSCPPTLEKNMTSLEVPLVSPEWLIQSVICGECLDFHSKPQYSHNFTSSSSSSSSS
ncbi:TP53-binding protein 1 isoform X3 [Nerophis lumbriciformis]|uniref:TP53-binding protein 1 isoform X3 n=1 Tax=Nerophis lumbriciformis TaxID=546530 RepID=UPI002AE072AA|nr:TP53-binding protein 1-like isoform X3 [Nerophis lumbriciformis]